MIRLLSFAVLHGLHVCSSFLSYIYFLTTHTKQHEVYIDRAGKKVTRIQSWEIVTRKRKKIAATHTPTAPANILGRRLAPDRPPLGQQRSTSDRGREGEREDGTSLPPRPFDVAILYKLGRRHRMTKSRASLHHMSGRFPQEGCQDDISRGEATEAPPLPSIKVSERTKTTFSPDSPARGDGTTRQRP